MAARPRAFSSSDKLPDKLCNAKPKSYRHRDSSWTSALQLRIVVSLLRINDVHLAIAGTLKKTPKSSCYIQPGRWIWELLTVANNKPTACGRAFGVASIPGQTRASLQATCLFGR